MLSELEFLHITLEIIIIVPTLQCVLRGLNKVIFEGHNLQSLLIPYNFSKDGLYAEGAQV